MKQIIKKLAPFVGALAFVVAAIFAPAPAALAQCDPTDMTVEGGLACAKGDDVASDLFSQGGVFTTVVNVLLFVIGAVSVIMLIWGGIRYTTSAGNSTAVTSAKNTIMYAIIGLVVAFLAYAIVNWVLTSLGAAN